MAVKVTIVNDNNSNTTTSVDSKVLTSSEETLKNPTGKDVAKMMWSSQIAQGLKSSAKSMFDFSVSRYGDLTGDYINQNRIQNQISATTGLIGLGTSIGMGFATGGVVGGVIAISTSAISLGTQAIQQSIQYNATISKANAKANFNSLRIGEILVNGNRG